eukprot:tig00020723_g13486.t1
MLNRFRLGGRWRGDVEALHRESLQYQELYLSAVSGKQMRIAAVQTDEPMEASDRVPTRLSRLAAAVFRRIDIPFAGQLLHLSGKKRSRAVFEGSDNDSSEDEDLTSIPKLRAQIVREKEKLSAKTALGEVRYAYPEVQLPSAVRASQIVAVQTERVVASSPLAKPELLERIKLLKELLSFMDARKATALRARCARVSVALIVQRASGPHSTYACTRCSCRGPPTRWRRCADFVPSPTSTWTSSWGGTAYITHDDADFDVEEEERRCLSLLENAEEGVAGPPPLHRVRALHLRIFETQRTLVDKDSAGRLAPVPAHLSWLPSCTSDAIEALDTRICNFSTHMHTHVETVRLLRLPERFPNLSLVLDSAALVRLRPEGPPWLASGPPSAMKLALEFDPSVQYTPAAVARLGEAAMALPSLRRLVLRGAGAEL